ncbi:hypothetical protein [Pedobacter arcticus]|uniref:hypothetical protein n=1 Tax=Pedobacter arcticus TaxID=752140 RepID=UPI00030D3DB2|nr:hypothetical protein [Pedobacter arcticus]
MSLFIMGCTKNKGTIQAVGQITEIESLSEISLGQTDTVVVIFNGGTNGCAIADHLETKVTDNSVSIKAYYNYPKAQEICTTNIPVHTLKYTFKPTKKGLYTYKSFDGEITVTTLVK